MRTLHRPLALLVALTTLAAPAALVADELEPSQQFQFDDGTTSGGEPKPCRFGSRTPCGTETIETCTERSIQPGIGPGGITFTWYCVTKKITTLTLYKDD
jgi:hypothetical protein